MARQKMKKILKFFHFSRIFSIIFQFLMHIFEKLPQILGLCSIVKFRSTLEKSDPPPNILWTPLNRKILHKLLIINVTFQCVSQITI